MIRKIYRYTILLTILIALYACTLTFISIQMPDTAFANTAFSVHMKVTTSTHFGTQTNKVFFSMEIPNGWTVVGNSLKYTFPNSAEYNLAYNSTALDSLAAAVTPRTGYQLWSGETQAHNVLSGGEILLDFMLIPDGAVGNYSIQYWMGDDYDNLMTEVASDPQAIEVINNPLAPILYNAFVAPQNPCSAYPTTLSVAYSNMNNDTPVRSQVIVGGTPYNLDDFDGNIYNGAYSVSTLLAAGSYDYHYEFEYVGGTGILRLPESGEFTGLVVAPVHMVTIPYTETFEDDSATADWEIGGLTPSWEVGIPAGLSTDPGSAYAGTKCIGTDLTNDGLVNDGEESYIRTPVYDARTASEVNIGFRYYADSTFDIDDLEMYMVRDFGEPELPCTLIAPSNEAWVDYTQDLSAALCGHFFQIELRYTDRSGGANAGISIDNYKIYASQDYEFELIAKEVRNGVLPESMARYPIEITNDGSLSDTYDLLGTVPANWAYHYETIVDSTIITELSLSPGANETIYYVVEAPAAHLIETREITASIEIESQNDATMSHATTVEFYTLFSYLPIDGGTYGFYSSDSPHCPAYNWVENNASTVTLGSADYNSTNYDMEFNFPYFNDTYDFMKISENGNIGLTTAANSRNYELPSNEVSNIIALMWGEVVNGTIYKTDATVEGKEACVVTYEDFNHGYGSEEIFTGQIILFDTGEIRMQYKTIDAEFAQNYASIGIDGYADTDGLTYTHNVAAVRDNFVVSFSPSYVPHTADPNDAYELVELPVLTWQNPADIVSLKVQVRTGDAVFIESDTRYDGVPITQYDVDEAFDFAVNTSYHWRVVYTTVDGREFNSKNWYFYTAYSIASMSGHVYDIISGLPIEGAIITKQEGEWRESRETRELTQAVSDVNGAYQLAIPQSQFYVTCEASGYAGSGMVYIDASSGTVVRDFNLQQLSANLPVPLSGTWDTPVIPELSWSNPSGITQVKVYLAENDEFNNPVTVYDGAVIDTLTASLFASGHATLNNSKLYFWRVDVFTSTSQWSPSPIWRFLTEFNPEAPDTTQDVTLTDWFVRGFCTADNGDVIVVGANQNESLTAAKLTANGGEIWRNSYPVEAGHFEKVFFDRNGNIVIANDVFTSYIHGDRTGYVIISTNGTLIDNNSYKYDSGGYVSNESLYDMELCANGDYIAAGGTGFRNWDFLLTRITPGANNADFQKTYGEAACQEICYDVLVCSDGGFLMTGYKVDAEGEMQLRNSRVWVIKTDASGSVEWEYEGFSGNNGAGNTTAYGYGAVELDDGFAIAGKNYYSGGNSTPNRALLIKLDASGNEIFEREYPLKFYATARGISKTADGGFLLSGDPGLIKTDAAGNLLWASNISTNSGISFFPQAEEQADGSIITIYSNKFYRLGIGIPTLDSPANLHITAVSATGTVSLKWDAVSGAVAYRIEAAASMEGSYSAIGTTSATQTTVINTETVRYFRVIALN